MSDLLSQIPTDSPPLDPRADWLTANGIVLQTAEDGFGDGTIHIASIKGRLKFATGDTAEQALVGLCRIHHIKPLEN